jgi:two-component system sensor histidine kinase PhcS
MAASSETSPDTSLLQAYAEFDMNLRIRQTRIITVLAITLVPLCIGLDFFVYPELLWKLFESRIFSDVFLIPLFGLLFTPWGKRHIRKICCVPPAIPAVAIAWMIYATEGTFSPYYAGMNIVLVAVLMVIPLTLWEGSFFCAFVIACYGVACWMHHAHPPSWVIHPTGVEGDGTLWSNFYFLGMTTIIALTSCHYGSKRRFLEFRLRHELDVNNRELATTLKKLQETEVQLVQSEKLNALGKLSAGLLHEINNPLNFTMMALQVAELEVGDNASLKDTLGDIGQGMSRIRSVISDLRAFAYPSKISDAEEFRVEEALASAMRLTAHELNGVEVDQQELAKATVVGAKTQIVHIFMNLLVNSAQAMKSKGLDRSPKIVIASKAAGDRLKISLRDNGIGIPRANMARLLEPFFTTKGPGEGTGLGLSICDTIVKNHGGTLIAASEEGQWTEMTFDLPLGKVEADDSAAVTTGSEAPAGISEAEIASSLGIESESAEFENAETEIVGAEKVGAVAYEYAN